MVHLYHTFFNSNDASKLVFCGSHLESIFPQFLTIRYVIVFTTYVIVFKQSLLQQTLFKDNFARHICGNDKSGIRKVQIHLIRYCNADSTYTCLCALKTLIPECEF